eukprot:1108507-Amphidinium_carterae.1
MTWPAMQQLTVHVASTHSTHQKQPTLGASGCASSKTHRDLCTSSAILPSKGAALSRDGSQVHPPICVAHSGGPSFRRDRLMVPRHAWLRLYTDTGKPWA